MIFTQVSGNIRIQERCDIMPHLNREVRSCRTILLLNFLSLIWIRESGKYLIMDLEIVVVYFGLYYMEYWWVA